MLKTRLDQLGDMEILVMGESEKERESILARVQELDKVVEKTEPTRISLHLPPKARRAARLKV